MFHQAGMLWSWLQDSDSKSLDTKSPSNADSGTKLFPNIRRKILRRVLPIYNIISILVFTVFFCEIILKNKIIQTTFLWYLNQFLKKKQVIFSLPFYLALRIDPLLILKVILIFWIAKNHYNKRTYYFGMLFNKEKLYWITKYCRYYKWILVLNWFLIYFLK